MSVKTHETREGARAQGHENGRACYDTHMADEAKTPAMMYIYSLGVYTRTYWKSAEDHGVLLADWPADCQHTTYMTELAGTPTVCVDYGGVRILYVLFTDDVCEK